jgi:ketosteroid isomerase-like protein
MSRERVEAILRAYEAINRGAPEESGLSLSADFEFLPPPMLPDTDVVRGGESLIAFLRGWGETFEDFRLEIEETIDAGDHVVVMAALRGKGRDSGADVHTPTFPIIWTFVGDQVVRMEAQPTRATAMEKLGIDA